MVQLLERELKSSNYINQSEGYLIQKKNYNRQYAPLYAERLASIRPELEKAAMKKWNEKYQVKKSLVDLENNQKSIIIGTLFKEMKKKPNILKEIADDENNMIPVQVS
jgi:DNA polymerase delta subunit 2